MKIRADGGVRKGRREGKKVERSKGEGKCITYEKPEYV